MERPETKPRIVTDPIDFAAAAHGPISRLLELTKGFDRVQLLRSYASLQLLAEFLVSRELSTRPFVDTDNITTSDHESFQL